MGQTLVYNALGQFHLALETINKVVELQPEDGSVYNSRGVIRRNLGQFEEALQDYNRAIQFQPHNADAYLAARWPTAAWSAMETLCKTSRRPSACSPTTIPSTSGAGAWPRTLAIMKKPCAI